MRRNDTTQKRGRIFQAVQKAVKLKYQPQNPGALAQGKIEIQSRFEAWQQRNTGIGRLRMLMSAIQDKNEIQIYLDHEERLRNDAIAYGKNANEEDYTAASQEFFRKMSDIKTKIEAHLTPGESEAILRSLEDAERKLSDDRVIYTANASRKTDTSHQKGVSN